MDKPSSFDKSQPLVKLCNEILGRDMLPWAVHQELATALRGFLSAPSTVDTPAALKIAARLEKRINTDTTIEPMSNHEQLDHDAAQMIRRLCSSSAIGLTPAEAARVLAAVEDSSIPVPEEALDKLEAMAFTDGKDHA